MTGHYEWVTGLGTHRTGHPGHHEFVAMNIGRDRVLRATAVSFACATAYNSVVAIREGLPGEPLGLRIRLPVSSGILVGWGAAVAAPWPMPVAALWATSGACQGWTGSALVAAGLGIAGIVGILIEPNTYKSRSWTPSTRRAVFLHVATSVAMAGAGIRHRRRTIR